MPATPEKFEDGALFLQVSLPSTLIHHGNEAFLKTLSKQEELEIAGIAFQ